MTETSPDQDRSSVAPSSGPSLLAPLIANATAHPDATALLRRTTDGYEPVTALETWETIRQVAAGLIASGIERGDRVAIFSSTRTEWLLLDYAVLAVGAITVPIYESSSSEQVEWIMHDSEAVMLVCERPELASRWSPPGTSPCREVLVIDGGDAMGELAQRASAPYEQEVESRIAATTPESTATIIYTSGTTARPKGCVLTHGNLRANVDQVSEALGSMVGPGDRTLLFLPLAHVLTRTAAFFCIARRIAIGFATDLEQLPAELQLASPSVLVGVPRIFEKVYNGAHRRAVAAKKGRIFDRAASVAIDYSRQRQRGSVSVLARLQHRLFRSLVYDKIVAGFGGSLRVAFSGGAPLGERLTSFFDGVGVRIFEGYGLTETSPILTINRAAAWKAGTVGRAVRDTEIRVGDDGGISARGPQVFGGYWKSEAATREVLSDDGWFFTGDTGTVDDDGYLTIVGRLKDIIVTAGGKNVAPAPLEDRLRSHELISQAMVVGEGRPYIAALLTIDAEALGPWAATRDLPAGDPEAVAAHPAVRAEVEDAVADANRTVSRAESIRSFVILPHDLAIESGELTPTLKVRRAAVAEQYATEIEALYAESGGGPA